MTAGAARRALVTGATGFVGGHLARRLVADGWRVDLLARPASAVPPALADHPRVRVHRVGGDARSVLAAVAGARPDVCWHLATLFRASHGTDDVDALVDANVAYGARLADALARTGTGDSPATLVNVGSSWQHAGGADYAPTSLYAATKQACEDLLRHYADRGQLDVVNLRLYDTYGPGDTRGKLLALLVAAARDGVTLDMSPGEQLVDLVHVDDVVDALVRAAEVPVADRAPRYAVSSGAPVTLRALAGVVGRVTGRPLDVRWGARPYRDVEMTTHWAAGPPPPGWAPRVALADGIARTWGLDHPEAP